MATHLCKTHWDLKGTRTRPKPGLNLDCLDCWFDWLSGASAEETFSLQELYTVLVLLQNKMAQELFTVKKDASNLIAASQVEKYVTSKKYTTKINIKRCVDCGAVHTTKRARCPTCTRKFG